ncbi:MAG: 2Fe-2S iron-sulfur cluster-binding protein, partial [Caldicoprobacterales bacterium]
MDGGKCTVTVISHERGENLICSKGSTLMDVFHKGNIYIDAPCGGKGICGKCKVIILRGQVSEISQDESRYLSDKERAEGYRLACMTKVIGDVEVAVKSYVEGAQIMSTGIEYSVDISPRINKRFVQLDLPTVEDQRDDLNRLTAAVGMEEAPDITIELMRELPGLIRDSNYKLTLVYDGNGVLNVEKEDTTGHLYGVAIDIGTTTVVCYLMDLKTGHQVDTISGLNAQRP